MINVLIVGAGPVGLTLALECKRHGVKFRIIDKNATPSDKSKALAVWSGTIECLAAMGVVDTFLEHSLPIHRLLLHDTGRFINSASIHEQVDSVYPYPFICPQSQTEALLIKKLYELGIAVERPVELVGLKNEQDYVEVQLKHADGRVEVAQAEWVVGCDGARSFVRHHLPVNFQGVTEDKGFILIDAKVEGELAPDSVTVNWGPACVSAFFPVKQGVFRMFAQRPDAKNQDPPTLEEMQAMLGKNGLGRLRLYDPEWLAYFAVNERYSSRIRVGRVFLCGDAAHIHSPVGGQGMNTGMQDAFNLGWKLGLLTRGKGSEEALAESVQEERHPVARALVEKTTMLLHAAMANNVFVRLAKDVAVTFLFQSHFVQKKLSGELSELHIAYTRSPLIVPDQTWPNHGGFEPGTKPRDAQLIHAITKAPTSLWRQYLNTRHTLLLFSGKNPNDRTMESLIDLADTLTSTHGDELQVLVVYTDTDAPSSPQGLNVYLDPAGKAHDRYGLEHAGWYLVRPDQYLAARSASLQTASLYGYLEKAVT